MLPPEAIKELQEIYYRKFGKKIDSQLALDMGTKLITMFGAIHRPIPSTNKNKNKNYDQPATK